jgi:hypothetical protein
VCIVLSQAAVLVDDRCMHACQKHRKLRYYELRRANVIVGLDGMIEGTLVSSGRQPRRKPAKFLTHKTTCASKMLEKITCRKICQKRPPTGGGTSGQATRGTCRLGRRRHGGEVGPAATAKSGRHVPRHPAGNG